jgi:hypothetical protein
VFLGLVSRGALGKEEPRNSAHSRDRLHTRWLVEDCQQRGAGLSGAGFGCDLDDCALVGESEADAQGGADAQPIALEVARSIDH